MRTEVEGAASAPGFREGSLVTQRGPRSVQDDVPISFQIGEHSFWAVRAGAEVKTGDSGNDNYETGQSQMCGMLHMEGLTYFIVARLNGGDDKSGCAADDGDAWETLSDREVQIALLVSHGKGTKQIAGRLLISEHTVRSYMRRIFSKLRVSTRPAMVAKLMSAGILCYAAENQDFDDML